jgi:type VI secretion system secreted protein Hcp
MAVNTYLKFENPSVKSGITTPGHVDEIEVLSWSHGFVQPTSPTRSPAGSGTVEQANPSNLSFTKYLDGASAALLKYSFSGRQFGRATLTCYRADGASDNAPVQYLQIVMQHVVISNINVSGGPGDVPVENVSLDYGTIQYNYTDQKPAGG